ncbi:hypothetical protein GGH94_001912 [Coemansia aciculifera]|uniref:Uncharacterized protein n=2 Tax=Coemansia TaxID=4863 RepID=A0A9W8M7Q5_9FUNG
MRIIAILTLLVLAFASVVAALSATQVEAIHTFMAATDTVGTENGPTMEEITHDLAVGLELRNSARLLYKYSPDAKSAYSTMYDSLLYLSVSGFSTPAQKVQLKRVIKYFESHLIT